MANPRPLDLNNVQGDILEGLGKKNEAFFFFQIKAGQASPFREDLRSFIPLITTTTEAKKFHQCIREGKKEAAKQGKPFPMIENSGVNISFSQKGLVALGITDNIGDDVFKQGMLADASGLGDDLSDWDADFKKEIHAVIIVTANSTSVLERTLDHIKSIFRVGHKDTTIQEVTRLLGQTRPGAEDGHEHFGFNDGLSQPAVKDVDAGVTSEPGEKPVRQGVILLGREGDDGLLIPGQPLKSVTRPSWALDGSFLAFRYLKQLVPEFDSFLEANALPVPRIRAPGDPTGAELLGARLVGRWKSGAPIDLTPIRDNPAFATREDFRFDPANQERCPFAAHVRKTNPRSDLDKLGGTEIRRIIRRGIAFGPEVTTEEKKAKKSSSNEKLERGLLFTCYQSNLGNGFHFMQESWANNNQFPPKTAATPPVPAPGIDPIIGVGIGTPRQMVGTSPDISKSNQELDFTAKWVIPRGGEYFFSPSISALKNTFAAHSGHSEL
ncbi:dyp-type peroxidase [Xylaria hypoxylon]|uniref:Dyp-type peroxidase n=1 Tax=Xylaria hypoxylon TaxID=37992 RepID=A0A4Z0YWH3_9PEZI|nr:dyp-type peroxidase [Xylaria hypoxylon]